MSRNKTAKVWSLGNTTVRNPERILGAIRVFNKYYKEAPTFSSNEKQQGEFFEKLLTHTDSGELFDPKTSNEFPIYSYSSEGGKVEMPSDKYKQKNGRLWLSPMNGFGFICAYNQDRAFICSPAKILVKYPEMEGDVWLRQLAKFQYPSPFSEISEGADLRPAIFLFKLMLELDGLSKFELGLCHLTRNEDIKYHKSMIMDYRKKRKDGEINKLKDEIKNKAILNHFSKDIGERLGKLKGLFKKKIVLNHSISEEEISSQIDEIVSLGKGSNTRRAKLCKNELIKLFRKKEEDVDAYKKSFQNYYFLVKGDTIGKDYPDLTKRYLSMSRILQQYKTDNVTRLRIDPEFKEVISDLVDSIGGICNVSGEKKEKTYLDYLRDFNKPSLLIDDNKYIEKEIKRMKGQLEEYEWKFEIKQQTDDEVDENRVVYNKLKVELFKAKELEYANNLKFKDVLKEIDEISINVREVDPTEVETRIWDSLLYSGSFVCHPSKTRNFHIDNSFKSIFTAAGNQPDMQFYYDDLDVVVEVTKNTGKTQWKAEVEPVTRHIATHAYSSDKNTIGLFLAPKIHTDTTKEFYQRSKDSPVILEFITVEGKIVAEQKINIVPLTFEQYSNLFRKKSGKNIHKEIAELSKIVEKSDDEEDWLLKIDRHIG
jgi:hypothetical protein